MSRSNILVALVVAALAAAGCGGASRPRNKISDAPVASRPFVPVLVDELVVQDAYASVVFSGAARSAHAMKAALAHWRASVIATDAALHRQKVPPAAASAYASLRTANRNLVLGLEELGRLRKLRQITGNVTTLNPLITGTQNAELALRRSLGIRGYAWFEAQPSGPPIYTDNLSRPHDSIRWIGRQSTYRGGGLSVSATRSTGLSAPSTPYRFDSRHVSLEVDETSSTGQPVVGILCPRLRGGRGANLVGEIGPGAEYSFGLLHLGGAAYTAYGPVGNGKVRAHGPNHLRLDCDQYSARFLTARLYVNGRLLDTDSIPGQLSANLDGGLLVSSRAARAKAIFKNWRVSKLGGGSK
jgi:hypothetical protein